jgi:uncharacterized protein
MNGAATRFAAAGLCKSYNVTRHLAHRQILKLQLLHSQGANVFTGYGEGYVAVNQRRYQRSLVVLPDRLWFDWEASTFEALAEEHLAALLSLDREVILLGTGTRLRFPRPEILRPLTQAGMGLEVMDIPAACRTYNILVSEERKVAAALLLG